MTDLQSRDRRRGGVARTANASTTGHAGEDRRREHQRLLGHRHDRERPHAERHREPSLVVEVDQRVEEVPPREHERERGDGRGRAALQRHRHAPPGRDRREAALAGEVEQVVRQRESRPGVEQHEQRRHAEQRRRHQRDRRVGEPEPAEDADPPHEQRRRRDHQHDDAQPDQEDARPPRQPRDREPRPRGDEHRERHGDGGHEQRVRRVSSERHHVEHLGVVAPGRRRREPLHRRRAAPRRAGASDATTISQSGSRNSATTGSATSCRARRPRRSNAGSAPPDGPRPTRSHRCSARGGRGHGSRAYRRRRGSPTRALAERSGRAPD